MRIVLVNDDGVYAGGILALARVLSEDYEVTVIAPDRERSATSHSITLDRPLTVRQIYRADIPSVEFYSVNGTPVDCVHMAKALSDADTELLVSGINNGANLGGDVSYSGTVHAALEASACGIPAIALSLRIAPHLQRTDLEHRFSEAALLSRQIIAAIDLSDLDNIIYNINFPTDIENCPQEIRVCPQGISVYSSVFQKQTDPFGREVYWLYAQDNDGEYNEKHKTDVYWSNLGYATCTPMSWNATALDSMASAHRLMFTVKLRLPS